MYDMTTKPRASLHTHHNPDHDHGQWQLTSSLEGWEGGREEGDKWFMDGSLAPPSRLSLHKMTSDWLMGGRCERGIERADMRYHVEKENPGRDWYTKILRSTRIECSSGDVAKTRKKNRARGFMKWDEIVKNVRVYQPEMQHFKQSAWEHMSAFSINLLS